MASSNKFHDDFAARKMFLIGPFSKFKCTFYVWKWFIVSVFTIRAVLAMGLAPEPLTSHGEMLDTLTVCGDTGDRLQN